MKRRKDLRESMTPTMDLEMTQSTSRNGTVAMEHDGVEEMETIVDPMEEIREAENLVEKLTSNREKKLKELSSALEPIDDSKQTPSKAPRRKVKRLAPEREIETIPEQLGSREDDVGQQEEGEMGDEGKGKKRKGKARKDSKEPMSMEEAVIAAQTGVVMPESSKNLNASIRERIKMRVMKAKEKAEEKEREEVEKDPEKDLPSRLLRGLRARDMATRFDDPSFLTKEEEEEDKILQQSLAAKSKWKAAFKAIKAQQSILPSEDEIYDFFTRNFDPEPEEPPKPTEEDDVPPEDQPGPSTAPQATEGQAEPPAGKTTAGSKGKKEGEEKPLLSEFFLDRENWKDFPTEMKGPEFIALRDREDLEKGYYFIPSVAAIPAEEKIVGDAEPRFLEDEGFYVGVRPEISTRNQNVMEHRLLNRPDKGKEWFGDDGRIKVLPDPLKETPTRPKILSNEEREPFLQVVYKKAVTTEFDHRYIDGLGDNLRAQYQLDIDVNMLVFTHHSLFSKEHVLASKLQQMYNQFLKSKQKNTAQYLSEKLQALKLAVHNLQSQLQDLKSRKMDPEASIVDQSSQRMMDYKNEIRDVRRLRDNQLLHDRQLLRNILKVWKDVKALREEQGCTNTPVKLSIHKEESNKVLDQAEWKAALEEDVEEMRLEYEEDHQGEMERYRTQLAAWKEQNKLKKAKKKKKRQGSQENLAEQDEAEEDANEAAQIPKPVKPDYEFNEEEASAKVTEKMYKCRRRPGEPIITPELNNTAVITPTHECPKTEQSRRSDVQRCKCFVKVLFNHKEVSRTATKSLTAEFTIHFGEIFNIQIVQWPESVILQVYETGVLSNTLLAEIYSAVPETQVTADKIHLEEFEFSSDQHIAYDHSAVGSGVSFQLGGGDSAQELTLLTSGVLMSSVAWGLGDDETPLVPPANQNTNALSAVKHLDAVAAIGATGMIDPERLAKWVAEARLDPNDPANANLLYLMKDARAEDGQGYRVPDFFRLEQLQEEFNFMTDAELAALKRLRLIELRQKEAPEFRNYKMIPVLEKEIPDTLITEYEKRKKKEEEGIVEEDMDPHRVAVAKFLGKVRERVIARFRAAQHQYSLQDVVNEEQVPDISMLGGTLVKLFEPRRPLRPQRKERKTVTAQNLSGLDVRLLVNIERAVDIPIRRGTARQAGTGQTQSAPQVRPFVEITFQQTVQRTSVTEGPNPNWNEELKLPFIAPNDDYSSANLQTVKDTIYIHLFDEVVTDLLEDDRDRGTNIHQRMERRWLGSISMPFTTVYFQGRVSGTFRMEAPMVLLGYDRSSENVNPGSANATYLTLFITIEPPLTSPEKLKEKFDSNEDDKLLAYAESYQTESLAKFPKRELVTTVMDINGKAVFITRYFRPIKPPDEVLGDNVGVKAAERVARFVSLIPFVSDSVVYPGLCDIWSTCDQFLQMLQGDEEEHAVLLCNYFLHLNKKAWLISGAAIPEGPTTYVLTREDGVSGSGGYWVWNPSTGEHYSQFDSFCPLKSVGCLVNHENIWFNIQLHEEPIRIDLDVTKAKMWKPFFGRSYPNPGLSSVQPTELNYYQTDREYVADLQDKIEKKLRDCIMAWRPRHITRWNRYCTTVFRKILRKLEFSHAGTDEHQGELQQILDSYNLCGFPLQMSYTEMRTVVEKVRSTNVHANESSDVEFGLAVHIHAYPNSVLSVWVYLASMTRKR
ncbi:coiled-coil and C2 domain-containing protein 2A-like isoform X2 [Patiria miniata]|nr:coiled-coil and C2 domain-containing protein 2A-like isoform X2 [Patiria miniata]XP_038057382.1 coiled-coil and C2 domain-containing protein 2A-like isoform X2 [Patiria miniata]